jgi:hypothetical protein
MHLSVNEKFLVSCQYKFKSMFERDGYFGEKAGQESSGIYISGGLLFRDMPKNMDSSKKVLAGAIQ